MPQTQTKPAGPDAAARTEPSRPGTLTFVASDGERIVFTDMDQPLGEVVPLAAEEALG